MRVVTVVGVRPQFVKAAPFSRVLRDAGHEEILVHTGQHYDFEMSRVFFDELAIPEPDVHLGVGSASREEQLGRMQPGIEDVVRSESPDWVLVYGDANSTLAAARAAGACEMPLAHVEAGVRSFGGTVEEGNRVETDRLSALLLCPAESAARHLADEGVTRGVHVVGDVMADALRIARSLPGPDRLAALGLERSGYVMATFHRAENTDDRAHLRNIFEALAAAGGPVFLPLHPRTRERMVAAGAEASPNVVVHEPLGFLDSVAVVGGARVVLTDSGGLQKEAYWLETPCVTLREETEWGETVATGWNVLAGTDPRRIAAALREAERPAEHPELYGDGHAAERIVALLESSVAGLVG